MIAERSSILLACFASSALAACATPAPGSPPREPAAAPAPIADAYCPPLPGLGPWRHEVFPACAPPPFGTNLHVCATGACPAPCAMTADLADSLGMAQSFSAWRYEHDAHGRWTRTRPDEDGAVSSDMACTYAGDRVATCTLDGVSARADRDARGRITRVVVGDTVADLAYGARGEVVSVAGCALRYDAAGRIASVALTCALVPERVRSELQLERDASGRVVRELGPATITSFTYEPDGRVREAATRARQAPLAARPPAASSDPDAVTAAGRPHGPDEICLPCDGDFAEDALAEDAAATVTVQRVRYDGARIISIAAGVPGPHLRVVHYSYACDGAPR